MKISDLIYQIATDLNDAAKGHEYTVWTREQIGVWIEEAIQVAFVNRPDLFLVEKIIKIAPCSILQDTCGCSDIVKVLGQSTKDGRVIKELRIKSNKQKLQWPGKSCTPSPLAFELSAYSIDGDRLRVYPEVPARMDIYILVECSAIPDTFADDYEVSIELIAAIKQYVLFRAKMVDGENNPAILQVATVHRDTFWQLLSVQAAEAEKREAEDE